MTSDVCHSVKEKKCSGEGLVTKEDSTKNQRKGIVEKDKPGSRVQVVQQVSLLLILIKPKDSKAFLVPPPSLLNHCLG